MNLKLPCGVPVIHPPDPVADWQLGLPDTSWYHESVIANIASPGQNQTQNSKHGFCGMCMAFAPSSSQKIVSHHKSGTIHRYFSYKQLFEYLRTFDSSVILSLTI